MGKKQINVIEDVEYNNIKSTEFENVVKQVDLPEILTDQNGNFYIDLMTPYKSKWVLFGKYNVLPVEYQNQLSTVHRRLYFNYQLFIYSVLRGKLRIEYIYNYIQLLGQPKPKNEVEMIEEYFLCKSDPKYFIQNYQTIEIPGKSVNLIMNTTQLKFVEQLQNDHDVITLKSRQVGISTIMQQYIQWVLTFYSGMEIGIISKDRGEAITFAGLVKDIIDGLPKWMHPKYKVDNKQMLETLYSHQILRSAWINLAKPENTLRGRPLSGLVIDEAQFISKLDVALTGMSAAVERQQSNASRRNLPYFTQEISTPNGMDGIGGVYYEHVVAQMMKITSQKYLELHWSQVPEFQDDPDWYKKQTSKYKDKRLIMQEYELKFLGSRTSLFDDDIITKLQEYPKLQNIIKAYNFTFTSLLYMSDKMNVREQELHEIKKLSQEDINKIVNDPNLNSREKKRKLELVSNMDNDYLDIVNNQLRIYEEFNRMYEYVCGIDVASESGGDESAFFIINKTTMTIQQEFSGKLSMENYQQVIDYVYGLYPRIKFIPESNGVGKGFVEMLKRNPKILPNMYHEVKYGKNDKITSVIQGFNTSGYKRPLMIDTVFKFCNENTDRIISKPLQNQLIQLKRINGKIQGNHDDKVMQFQIALYQIEYNLTENENSFDIGNYNLDGVNVSNVISVIQEQDNNTKPNKMNRQPQHMNHFTQPQRQNQHNIQNQYNHQIDDNIFQPQNTSDGDDSWMYSIMGDD